MDILLPGGESNRVYEKEKSSPNRRCLMRENVGKDGRKGWGLRGIVAALLGAAVALSVQVSAAAENPSRLKDDPPATARTLDECISAALENNHRRPVSALAVAVAEAQHRQVLSGYWPQIGLKGGYMRMDESFNFLFPETSVELRAQTMAIPFGGTIPVTIPGVGTVPVSAFPIDAQTIQVPGQDIKLMDENSYFASLNAKWLIYDGGMRKGYREQTLAGIAAAKQEVRRTDLEIVDCIRRYYHGAVLARQLLQLGRDTLARMEATLSLTEALYKEGSGKVTKVDFLDNKVMVESLRSMVALLEKNAEMAKAALANTMGLSWREAILPAEEKIPFEPFAASLEAIVSAAYEFSPDWARLEAGIRASEGAVKTAQSGSYPKLALMGELHRWWNGYDAGLATDRNKNGWTIGVGIEIPIFDGFLVRGQVEAAKAKSKQLNEQRILLKDGLGLQIKDLFLGLEAARQSHQAALDAMTAARENCDLNTRAYQNGLVDTEKVVRAQLVDALMTAQHYKTVYDHVVLQSQMNLLVGTEVLKQLK
jgi:outer membrane protein